MSAPTSPQTRLLGSLRGRARGAVALLGFLLVWTTLHAGCGGEQLETVETRANVLLVTLDTTRADRLGCYGHAAAATPHLDRLAQRGVRFLRAHAHAPVTLPSHASILTGVLPPEHGIHDNGLDTLPGELETLATRARAAGYRTGAFLSAAALDSAYGLDRGFEVYDDDLGEKHGAAALLERRGGITTSHALEWLATVRDDPWLCWVHLFDPHAPYAAPPPFSVPGRDPYDAEIAYTDAQVGRLLEWLKESGVDRRTIVLVVADHGEGLGEHDEPTHAAFAWETTLHVPCLLFAPGVAEGGRTIDALVGHADLAPTLLELLGLRPLPAASGRSLVPCLRGEDLPPRPLYVESEYCAVNFGWAPIHGLIVGHEKLLRSTRRRLFDLAADPRELRDLAAKLPDRAADLEGALDRLLKGLTRRHGARLADDEELRARMEGLGYTATLVSGEGLDAAQRRDPFEHSDVLRLYSDAVGAAQRGDSAAAVTLLRRVIERCPEGAGFRTMLGIALLSTGEAEEAARELERAVRDDPRYVLAHYTLAGARDALGDDAGAREALRATLLLAPTNWRARRQLARLLAKAGEFVEAAEELREAIRLRPEDARAWIVLSEYEERAGRPEAALRVLEEAIGALPRDPGLRFALARRALASGEPSGARRALEVLRPLRARDPATRAELSLLIARARLVLGDRAGAANHAREAMAAAGASGRTDLEERAREVLAAAGG